MGCRLYCHSSPLLPVCTPLSMNQKSWGIYQHSSSLAAAPELYFSLSLIVRLLTALLLRLPATVTPFEFHDHLEGESFKCWAHRPCFPILLHLPHPGSHYLDSTATFLTNIFNVFYPVSLFVIRRRIGVKQPRSLPEQNLLRTFQTQCSCSLCLQHSFFIITENFILIHTFPL